MRFPFIVVKNLKVWYDYKYKVKAKLRANAQSLKKTGGGPYKEKKLNVFEESVIRSCGLESTVGGIKSVKSYGSRVITQTINSNELAKKISDAMPVNDFEIGEEMHEFITYSPEPEASSFQNNEVDKENDNNAETNRSKRQKTNADKQHEKTALFKRYVEAMEKSNVIQERLVKIKEENQLIKRKTLELAEYKYALKKRKYDETTGSFTVEKNEY